MEARYLTDENGKRIGAFLDIAGHEQLREIEDDMEDVRRYDEAIARRESGEDDAVPWEQVRGEIGSEYEEPTGSSWEARPRGSCEDAYRRTGQCRPARP